MRAMHDSRDTAYRCPAGALPCGAEVLLRLRILCGETPDAVHLRLWFGKESFLPMRPVPGDTALYEAAVRLPEFPCLVWYDFQVFSHGQFLWYGNAEDGLGGVGAPVYGGARSFQITVYDPAYRVPAWVRGAVFYQIFPDRFARGAWEERPKALEGRTIHESWDEAPLLSPDAKSGDNEAHDFFAGTLRGILEKLPYLSSLGVTALYLNPIFHAGTNHRFDTIDWRAVDPLLGTEDDFLALCAAAERSGIRVVLDGVFSHSGHASPLFRHAQTVPDSPYRNWYQFEHWPDMYKSWWGFPTLPDLNKHHPEVIDYFLLREDAVVRKWVRDGASGWRIDVADELPMEYLKLMRRAVKETSAEAILLGEVWEDASNKISYGQMRTYCLGDTLDGVMNYPLRQAAIDFLLGKAGAAAFKRRMDSLYENYPAPFAASLLNVLGTHDRPRTLNVLAGADGEDLPREKRGKLKLTARQREMGKKRLKLLLALIVAMPGMPCVYYGDEAGMEGAADPFNRAPFPWGREDKALTAFYKEALSRRRTVPALSDGALRLEAPHEDVLVIERETPGQTAVTVVNRSPEPRTAEAAGKTVAIPAYGFEAWES